MWASICPTEKVKFTLEERSDDLLKKLLDAGLGQKPIVWVTHSMGGLIVKNILCKATHPIALLTMTYTTKRNTDTVVEEAAFNVERRNVCEAKWQFQ
ncbi:hypothetical protein JTB14_034460 [Gonioctena quinquepunctata]|nr:hypothetical protein JTB14_034460 [Gonioctena quinquepunctata]